MLQIARSVSSLVGELKRRHVFRVAVVYAGVAWLVIQIADTWLSALQVPEWTITFIVVLASLGFPIAIVLAWALEITPGGVKLTAPLGEGAADSDPAPGVVVSPVRMRAERSIAVLPFTNLSSDPENEYLSDGVTEELLNALAQVDDLRVASRTSTAAYKGRGEDVRQIGEHLGVTTVLEGSIRRAGSRLRIRAQLTEVETGYQIWSQMFERQMDDLFELQDDISRAIADSLTLKLPSAGAEYLERRRTAIAEAYQHYLKGRYFWNRRTEEALHQAVEHFSTAMRLDPDYALAHAGLADSYSLLVDYGLVAPSEALPVAEKAATRALQIDPTLSEAHTSLAIVKQFSWDWAEAERQFRRSLELDPNNAVARHRYALLLTWIGRFPEALDEIGRAAALDPTSLIISTTVGWIHYYARQYAQAERQLQAALQMDPNFAAAHLALGLTRQQTGDLAGAIQEFHTAMQLSGENPSLLALLAYACGKAGDADAAHAALERLQALEERRYLPPFYLAIAALGTGDREDALNWLERAYAERSNHLAYLVVDPQLDELCDEAAFQSLCERVGLTQRLASR